MRFGVLIIIAVVLTTSLGAYLWSQRASQPRICGGKFKAIGSKCYYIESDNEQVWLGALYQCSRLGGHLASIKSQQELDDISKELMPNKEYFIDISDQIYESGGFLSATTGLAPSFIHPDLKDSHDSFSTCVFINTLGHMDYKSCDLKKLFVCEKHEEVTQEQKQKIEKNFKKIGQKFYYIENEEPRIWLGAFFKCQELGGHLATLKNDQEIINISQELNPGSQYFIDLTDTLEEDKYLSITSGSNDNYIYGGTDEPRAVHGWGEAVAIIKFEVGTFMAHVSEFGLNYFICEASI